MHEDLNGSALVESEDLSAEPWSPDRHSTHQSRTVDHGRQAEATTIGSGSADCHETGLTRREREILALVASGLSAKQIGLRLTIAPRTVDRHIDHLKMKMRAKNRAHMIALAIFEGLIRN